MRIVTAAAAAAALVALAACEPEPTTVVTEPEVMNDAAVTAAETPGTSVTPIEFGNGGDANGAGAEPGGFEANGTTVVADPDNVQ